jgi:D-alanyl-D-alanine carboxypeptidase/D-alanyl-D-alanine-endopeptidase (penicillin-binding protein 4)
MDFFLAPALLLCASASYGASPDDALRAAAADFALRGASWGASVKYADTGEEAASMNPGASLVPGSTLKLLVTAAALGRLGEAHRFETRLYRTKDGELFLLGGGDPTLGSGLAKGSRPMAELFGSWAGKLRDLGVRDIRGVAADNSPFAGPPVPESWLAIDVGNYYAAPADALSINDNLYRLFLRPGRKAGRAASPLRMEPEVPGLRFVNRMRTGPAGSGDNGYISCPPGKYRALLTGTIPAGEPEFEIKGAIPEPALFAARSLRAHLIKEGFRVRGKARLGRLPSGADLVLENRSPPLMDIVSVVHKRSFNLYAEMLGRGLATRRGRPGSLEEGLRAELDFLASASISTGSLRLFDFCGLSDKNRIDAKTLSNVLVLMARGRHFEAFRESLVFPGDPEATGHIRRFGPGLEDRLRVKSGSLRGVRSYAGYLKTRSGRWLAFAFILNGYSCSPAEVERLHEGLARRLASE